MAKVRLNDDSERMIPALHKRTIMYAEHMTRYIAAQDIVKDKVILDIASGSGYGSNMLSKTAKKVYGVDISNDAVAYAKKNYREKNIEFKVGSAEKIPLSDNSVDVVVTFETLEHIKDYRKFIKEISRVLKDDGIAIISTPNDEEFAEGNHFHLHEFKYRELMNLLGKTFSHLKPYHQATWAYVQISEDKFIGGNEAVTNVEVHNFAPIKTKQYLYFYILCSNREIKERVRNIGGLGGHYSAREMGNIFAHYQKVIGDHKEVLARTKIKLKMRENENHAITQSASYKLAKLIARPKHYAYKGYQTAKIIYPGRLRKIWLNKVYVKKAYNSTLFKGAFAAKAQSDTAVIIHLYYVDMLPFFVDKLKRLSHIKFDTYITIPDKKSNEIDYVKEQLPHAHVAIVPNCGRDVLPFVQTMKQIESKGYKYVLKMHSKKSPHRADGDEWRDKMIDSLIPSDPKQINKIFSTLKKKNTAIVGPTDEYVSMLVNYTSTIHHVTRLVKKLTSNENAKLFMRHPDEYGFFAGTMFWVKVDSIMSIIDAVQPDQFEPEYGQQDSTLAHALERILNVIPELQGMDLYQLKKSNIEKVEYHSTNIPSWAEYAIDD